MRKPKTHDSKERCAQTVAQDASDALFLAIKSKNLPYLPATLNRVTKITYDTGEVIADYFLDYEQPQKQHLVRILYKEGQAEVKVCR